MKKILLLAVLTIVTVSATFADDLNNTIVENLKKNYSAATNINWEITDDYTLVEFTLNGQKMRTFYNTDGNLIGISKKVEVSAIPTAFASEIAQKYAGYVVTEALLFNDKTDNNSTKYYITVTGVDSKVVLQFDAKGHMSKFQTIR